MKFGIFYEHQLPRPWDEGAELRLYQEALDQVELADRLGIDYAWEVEHHFLEEYSHSPRTRGVSRRLLAAHQAHPARPRHRADAAEVQPSGQGRGAHRHARSGLQRPRRVRHRRVGVARRARRATASIRPKKRAMWREATEQVREPARDGSVPRLPGQVLLDAVPQSRPQAGAEAASADVAGVLEPRDHPHRRQARPRRAHLRLRRSDRGAALGGRLLQDVRARVRADRLDAEPEHRHGDRLLLSSRTRRRRAAAASTASASSASRWRTTTCSATTSRGGRTSGRASRACATACRTWGRSQAASARPTMLRAHLRKFADVGVDQVIFIQQGGTQSPRPHLRIARAVRRRGDAGVQGAAKTSASAPSASASRRPSRRRSRASSSCARRPTRRSRASRLRPRHLRVAGAGRGLADPARESRGMQPRPSARVTRRRVAVARERSPGCSMQAV